MNMHQSREELISRQEKAARQQELLERKRKAKAEKNEGQEKGVRGQMGMRPDKPTDSKLPVSAMGMSGSEKPVKKTYRKEKRKQIDREVETSVTQWFLSICWMKIPLIGFLYAVFLAVYPKTPGDRKNFARGYLIYRGMVDLLSLTVLYILYRVGLDFVDQMLAFIR